MSLCHDVPVQLPDVAAAIIAGGQARRFGGQDKSRLVVGGRAIIVRQLEVLRRITSSVMVISNDETRFADLGVPVFADVIPGKGALGGLYSALMRADAGRVIVVACDLPFLDSGVLSRLVELSDGGDGAWVETQRGVEPLLACYRTSAAYVVGREIEQDHLRAGDLGQVLRMVSLGEVELERFGPIDRLLANVNSPDDHARVQ